MTWTPRPLADEGGSGHRGKCWSTLSTGQMQSLKRVCAEVRQTENEGEKVSAGAEAGQTGTSTAPSGGGACLTRPGQPEGRTRLRRSATSHTPTHPQRLAPGALEGCAPPSPHEILLPCMCLSSSLMKCLFQVCVAYFYCVDCFLLFCQSFESSLGIMDMSFSRYTLCRHFLPVCVSLSHIYCTVSFKTDILI